MAKFDFRLEKLFEYRQLQEKWAKDEYLACMAKRIEGEDEVQRIYESRVEAGNITYSELDHRLSQEQFLSRLESEQRAVEAAVAVLEGEEETARLKWIETKQNAEALEKLKQKAVEEWIVEENRREQGELDEWAVMRRSA